MTAIQSPESKREQDLLGVLIRALDNHFNSMMAVAEAWKACVDGGVNVDRYVDKRTAAKLEIVLRGKLIDTVEKKALLLPAPVLQSLEAMPKEIQERLNSEGIEVLAGQKVRRATLADITTAEIRQAFDITEGRPRLLSIDEQRERKEPVKLRTDKTETLRFTPAEYLDLERAARKEGSSVKAYLKRQLYLTGILAGVKRSEVA